ncbi:MAG: TauD/TfdA family dioxygenase [Cyanobacteria bacterium J06639_1]
MTLASTANLSSTASPWPTSHLAANVSLPLVVTPGDRDWTLPDLLDGLREHRDWFDRSLLESGGLLFRGFPTHSSAEFEAFVAAIDAKMLPYTQGTSPRRRVRNMVYNSTEYPANKVIELHNEMSYTHHPPSKVFFYSDIAAKTGGETPIADSRKVYQKLDPVIRDRFVDKQICYTRTMHAGEGFSILGKSWRETYETEDRDEVEAYLTAADMDFRWLEDGSLQTRQVCPAAIAHPVSGEMAWHSQAHLLHVSNFGKTGETLQAMVGEERFPVNSYYGDGTAIAPEDLAAIRELLWQEATIFPWQEGDVLVLDNLLVAHGRTPFKGKRRTLVAMTA